MDEGVTQPYKWHFHEHITPSPAPNYTKQKLETPFFSSRQAIVCSGRSSLKIKKKVKKGGKVLKLISFELRL